MCEAASATLDVCPESEVVTLLCEHCGAGFTPVNARQRFCSSNCRVAAHRQPQRERRWRWDAARHRDRSMAFDGRITGPIRNVGPLADFEKEKKITFEFEGETWGYIAEPGIISLKHGPNVWGHFRKSSSGQWEGMYDGLPETADVWKPLPDSGFACGMAGYDPGFERLLDDVLDEAQRHKAA